MNFTAMNSFTSTDNKRQEKCRVCTYSCMRKWEKEKTVKTYNPKPKTKSKQALPPENTIGGIIKDLRRSRGLTQAQLAEKAKTTKNSIARYERNENRPRANMLADIAEALGVSVDVFAGGSSK